MSAKDNAMKATRLICYIMLAISPELIKQLSALKTLEDVSGLIWTQWVCVGASIALPMWAVIRAYIDQSYGRPSQEQQK